MFCGIEVPEGFAERERVIAMLTESGYEVTDLTDNETAKLHIRYMVGGHAPNAVDERLFVDAVAGNEGPVPRSQGAVHRRRDSIVNLGIGDTDQSGAALVGEGVQELRSKAIRRVDLYFDEPVDAAVFEAVGYDPETVSGFAFGLGIDRIAMMRHGIDDLRLRMENEVRFLSQLPA